MLNRRKILDISDLLKTGRLSQREVAEISGVSRGTVNRVAMGIRKPTRDKLRVEALNKGKRQWCEACEAWIIITPCVRCEVLDYLADNPETSVSKVKNGNNGIDLRPADRARYMTIHRDHDAQAAEGE